MFSTSSAGGQADDRLISVLARCWRPASVATVKSLGAGSTGSIRETSLKWGGGVLACGCVGEHGRGRRGAVPLDEFRSGGAKMITGTRVALRPFSPDEAHHMYDLLCDLETYLIATPLPHIPRTVQAIRQRIEKLASDEPSPDKDILLAARSLVDDAYIGSALIWGIDSFNRFAHIGITLTPAARRQGFGTDVVRTLTEYAFRVRNLRRIEVETNASNEAMRRTAVRCGFTEEGRLRQRHYDGDGYVDVIIYGQLRGDCAAGGPVANVHIG